MGLVINSTTGVIDVSASTAGTYTVTYTLGTNTATQTITILDTPTASISGATSYCSGTGGVTLASAGGTGGDSYAWTKNGASTGQTTSSITGQTNGVYTVQITRPTGEDSCTDTSSNFTVTENPSQDASFAYQHSSYATDGTNPTPVITGDTGGAFTASPSGLGIDGETGQINLAESSVNNYTVTYSLSAPCPATSTQTVAITAPAFANTYSTQYDGTNDYGQSARSSSALQGSYTHSISAWVRFTGTSTLYPIAHSWANPYYTFILRYYDGKFQYYVRGNNNTTVNASWTTSITLNQWYHVAAVKDGGTMRLYVDGSQRATASVYYQTKANSSGNDKVMGAYGSWYGQGQVDELALWTGVTLSASDVTTIYNSGNGAIDLSDQSFNTPHNWWRMGDNDSGTGTTITDQGSFGNNLTLYNGASIVSVVP